MTIQHLGSDYAIILFELSQTTTGALIVTNQVSGVSQIIDIDPSHMRQQIVIDGLKPNHTYQVKLGLREDGELYRVPAWPYSPANQWIDLEIRAKVTDRPLRVGVIGDSGFGHQATFDLSQQMAQAGLHFILHVGDVVYHVGDNASPVEAFALKYYEAFKPLLRTMPIYPVVGNHDLDTATEWNGVPFYYYAFPPFATPDFDDSAFNGRNLWYAFQKMSVQFILLNTQTFFGEVGRTEQEDWLAERLADTRYAWTIPVCHVAPYCSGLHAATGSLVVRSNWAPLFESNPRIPIVLSGHDHNYERLQAGNTTYIVSGGGSLTLYEATEIQPESQFFARETHFVQLDIHADRIELQAINVNGEVIDGSVIALS
ncbi:MAG: hypothetical protein GYB68_14455 [Chloroflexi bacterium]|nr:hypothetical protein [Chloroflexota bacterium]